jgi:hypothetical protein
MNVAPHPIYLFLSSEKGFVAFCRIWTKAHKTVETIDTIERRVFSMLS